MSHMFIKDKVLYLNIIFDDKSLYIMGPIYVLVCVLFFFVV